ncbi:hypothetical protein HJG60_011787 [Phyllostomus discolor]|uniref:Uncharacterized protein n=1 Tax=Phyllostomus discolor TaxID=89673 RepID=A0A833ZCW1_9CHIR|nr:hypothetical protein HJG60_011787 [Phyllostomus discolor]
MSSAKKGCFYSFCSTVHVLMVPWRHPREPLGGFEPSMAVRRERGAPGTHRLLAFLLLKPKTAVKFLVFKYRHRTPLKRTVIKTGRVCRSLPVRGAGRGLGGERRDCGALLGLPGACAWGHLVRAAGLGTALLERQMDLRGPGLAHGRSDPAAWPWDWASPFRVPGPCV